jgi:hypothetical protein
MKRESGSLGVVPVLRPRRVARDVLGAWVYPVVVLLLLLQVFALVALDVF